MCMPACACVCVRVRSVRLRVCLHLCVRIAPPRDELIKSRRGHPAISYILSLLLRTGTYPPSSLSPSFLLPVLRGERSGGASQKTTRRDVRDAAERCKGSVSLTPPSRFTRVKAGREERGTKVKFGFGKKNFSVVMEERPIIQHQMGLFLTNQTAPPVHPTPNTGLSSMGTRCAPSARQGGASC